MFVCALDRMFVYDIIICAITSHFMYHVGIDVLCLSVLLVLYYFSPSHSVFAVRKLVQLTSRKCIKFIS